jgi:hypothetical protein
MVIDTDQRFEMEVFGDPAELPGELSQNLLRIGQEAILNAAKHRLVRLLSVGTRDQLSTLFRLTLAEELKTAVILDDQLTQTEKGLSAGIRQQVHFMRLSSQSEK